MMQRTTAGGRRRAAPQADRDTRVGPRPGGRNESGAEQ